MNPSSVCGRLNEESFQLRTLVNKYKSLFDKTPGLTNSTCHFIDTGDSAPISCVPYRYSPYKKEIIDDLINEMLNDNLIEPSNGPWCSPCILVGKKDGSPRLCIDYRSLNDITRKDSYPLPRIDDILDSLKSPRFITTLDMKAGYWQVPLDETSRDKASFVTHKGLYRPKVLMFGLTNAPGTFQRMIDHLFAPLRHRGVSAYLDDLIIISSSFEEHLVTLEEVFNILNNAGLTIKASKSKFCQTEATILGHVVNNAGVQVDPEKTRAIKEYPIPRNVKQLRRFLGMASYYRRFVKEFSKLAAPLNGLLRKDIPWHWSDDQQAAFDIIKNALQSAPIICPPDFTKTFLIFTDASSTGLGAVLCQEQDGKKVVVQYASCSLSAAERRYNTTERECLALVYAVKKFRPYIDGVRFEIHTDHSALQWLRKARDPTGKLARWRNKLQAHDFVIRHIPGKYNEVADALSRITPDTEDDNSASLVETELESDLDSPFVASALDTQDCVSFDNDLLAAAQIADPRICAVKTYLEHKSLPSDKPLSAFVLDVAPKCILTDGIMYRDVSRLKDTYKSYRIWVPTALIDTILKLNHDIQVSGHLGIFKTLRRVQSRYTWDGMVKWVTNYVKSCLQCQQHKTSQRAPPGLMRSAAPSDPWQVIGIDLKGPFPRSKRGFTQLLVVVDFMTKWTEIFPLRAGNTRAIVGKLVDEVFCRFGVPQVVVSDNGKQFVSNIMQAVGKHMGVHLRHTSFYSPQSNQTERTNRTIGTMIATYVTDCHQDWDLGLPQLAMAIRTAQHESTGFSPAFLNFGRELRMPYDITEAMRPESYLTPGNFASHANSIQGRVSKALEKAQDNLFIAQSRQEKYYNAKHRNVEYSVGQMVMRKTHFLSSAINKFASKLAPKWDGPFVIGQKCSKLTYRLTNIANKRMLKGTYHVSQLMPYVERRISSPQTPAPVSVSSDVTTPTLNEPVWPTEGDQPPTSSRLRPRNLVTGRVIHPPN